MKSFRCFFILVTFCLPFYSVSQYTERHPGMEFRARGTGRTTNHVITLTIENKTREPFDFPLEGFYIPSDGRHQGYLIPPVPDSLVVVDPGGTVSIPLTGYCTDIRKPPVNADEDPVGFDHWIPGSSVGPGPWPYDPVDESVFRPYDPGTLYKEQDDKTTDTLISRRPPLVITYPGTEVPFTYTIDITEHPEEAAPLLFDAVSRIHSNYVALRENPIPLFITPFSSDREREESSVVQQTLWIYTAALEGDPYTIEDFEDKMVDQLETSTGQDFMEMDERVQDQLTAGVEQFWDAFTLVGTQAKVIRETPVSTPEPVLTVQKEERFCEYQIGERPDSVFKMEIDDSWKDMAERARIIAEARQDIFSQGHWSPGEGYYTLEGGLRHHPTSASAFFRNNVIGGFCSGYAKTYLYEAGKGSEYVSSTEPINLNVGNTSAMVTMTVVPPPRWTAFVVGSSFTKLRASSSSFDAVAGNSEFGLDFLRVTKFAAKTSLKFLFDLATGQTTQTFLDYAKEAIKDELKSLTEEAAKEKLAEYINENFDDLLDELDIDLDDIQNIGEGDFKALIKDKLGIEIGSLDDLIDQGLDAALNLFFVSNTYAAANGGLVVKIGGQSEDALVHSRALYLRQELEDSGEAVAGTGEKVDSFYVSDVKENTITIETIGNVLMMTRAKGNGTADAYVESMQLQALVGVCKGPRPRYEWNTEIITGAYFHDQDNAPSMDESFIDQLVDGLDAKITAELDYDSSQEDWKNTVDAFIREKSLEYPFNK